MPRALIAIAAGAFAVLCVWRFSSHPAALNGAEGSRGASGAAEIEASSSTRPISAASPAAVNAPGVSDRKLLGDLEQIFASKNDNDPRLDTEFRNLSPETKRLLRQEYAKLPPESLNERGTIVFLLGRELKTPEDFAFLAQVGDQPVCLSLGDCEKQAPVSSESMHEEVAVSVTLTYPQRVALKSLENLLSDAQHAGGGDPARVAMALDTLGSMTGSPVGLISQKAAALQSRYSGLRH